MAKRSFEETDLGGHMLKVAIFSAVSSIERCPWCKSWPIHLSSNLFNLLGLLPLCSRKNSIYMPVSQGSQVSNELIYKKVFETMRCMVYITQDTCSLMLFYALKKISTEMCGDISVTQNCMKVTLLKKL